MNVKALLFCVALVMSGGTWAQNAIPYPPEPPDIPVPELPRLSLEQFQKMANEDISPFLPASASFWLAAYRLKADDDGPFNHVRAGECMIISELMPWNQKFYLIRPIADCGTGALQPGLYIAVRQGFSNVYDINSLWIKSLPKHDPVASEHEVELLVEDRDPELRNLPVDVWLRIETDHGASSGGGLHPGHVRFK